MSSRKKAAKTVPVTLRIEVATIAQARAVALESGLEGRSALPSVLRRAVTVGLAVLATFPTTSESDAEEVLVTPAKRRGPYRARAKKTGLPARRSR